MKAWLLAGLLLLVIGGITYTVGISTRPTPVDDALVSQRSPLPFAAPSAGQSAAPSAARAPAERPVVREPEPLVRPPAPPVEGGAPVVVEVPLPTSMGLSTARVTAYHDVKPGFHVVVSGAPGGGEAERTWTDLGTIVLTALMIAIEPAPLGLVVEIATAGDVPMVDALAPLLLGARLSLARRPWPSGQLVAGVVAPDGTIGARGATQRAEPIVDGLAAKAGLRRAWPRSVDAFLALSNGQEPRDAVEPSPPAVETGAEARQRRADRHRDTLQRATSRAMASLSPLFQEPPDWPELVIQSQRVLTSLEAATATDAIEAAWHAGVLARSLRGLPLVAARAERLVAQGKPKRDALKGPSLAELGRLTRTWVDCEADVRESLTRLARPRGRLPDTAHSWLQSRRAALSQLALALRHTLERQVPRPRSLDAAFPWSDARFLATRPADGGTESLVASYGDALAEVAALWTGLFVAAAYGPAHTLDVAGPAGLTLDERRIAELAVGDALRAAERALGSIAGMSERVPEAFTALRAPPVAADERVDAAVIVATLGQAHVLILARSEIALALPHFPGTGSP